MAKGWIPHQKLPFRLPFHRYPMQFKECSPTMEKGWTPSKAPLCKGSWGCFPFARRMIETLFDSADFPHNGKGLDNHQKLPCVKGAGTRSVTEGLCGTI